MAFKQAIRNKISAYRKQAQSGNAVVMLFAAIGVAGIIGYGLNTVMRGPAVTTAELSRRTIAENNLVASTRLTIAMSAKQGAGHGDCDGDGFVEPMEYRAGPGTAGAQPTGGGFLPMTIGASIADPWGTQYGYCVWNPGTVNDPDSIAACRTGASERRLKGSPRDNQPAIAIISAGPNGVFETNCNAYADLDNNSTPDTPMIDKPAGSDDIVLGYTYAEANGVGAGEWKIDKDVDPTGNTATIGKGLNVNNAGGSTSFSGSLTAAGGLILPRDAGDGNDTTTGPCDEAHKNQLRLNMSSDVPTLEICNFDAGAGWVPISGGGAAPIKNPSCLFSDFKKVGQNDEVSNGGTLNFYNNNLFSWVTEGGSTCDMFTSKQTSPAGFTLLYNNGPQCGIAGEGAHTIFKGNYVYSLYNGAKTLKVADISNPASPVNKATLTDNTKFKNATGIALLDDTHLVIISYDSDMLSVVDISNPLSPSIISSVTDTTKLNGASYVVTAGQYAYVEADSGMTIVDLSNIAAPVIVGRKGGMYSLGPIFKFDHYIIGVPLDDSKLYTIDVTDPTAPTIAATHDFTEDHLPADVPTAKLYGKYLFWTSQFQKHITIFDLSDPLNPVIAREASTSTNPDLLGSTIDITVKGNYLYMPGCNDDFSFCGFNVYNIGCDPVTGALDNSALKESMAPTATDRIDAGMVAHWSLDDGAIDGDTPTITGEVTTVKDSAGTNDGAFVSGTKPVWTTGVNGRSALSFNMDDRDAVKIPGLLGSPQNGTIAMWVNATRADIGPGSFFFSLGDALILKDSYDEGVQFSYWNGTVYKTGQTNENIIGTGWHYVTATWDNDNDIHRIYVDGVLKDEFNNTDALSFNAGTDTYIGRLNSSANYDFDGGIDDVRVWNVPLGPSEVAELYRRMKASSNVIRSPMTTAANNYRRSRVASGISHSCAIKADNSLWCWGDDTYGQLGNGSAVTDAQASPVKVGNSFYTSVSAGGGTTCAIDTGGTAWCWGRNNYGQTGTGSIGSNVETPTAVAQAGPWQQISVGEYSTCGITADGTAWCWGQAANGKLGNNTTSPDMGVPSQVADTGPWAYITTGSLHSCGIKTDGTAWCWGSDSNGQLGNGSVTGNKSTPSQVSDPGPWANITAGSIITGDSTCGVKVDGTAWCWGQDNYGMLGNGPDITADQTIPYPVNSNLKTFSHISLGDGNACGTTVDGSLYCWGDDTWGILGNGPDSTVQIDYPKLAVSGATGWNGVAIGIDHICAAKADGTLWCWGRDTTMQLGNGTVLVNDQQSPTPVLFVDPATFGWDDAQSIIMGNPGYNLAIGAAYLSETGASQGFGFTLPGKATFLQTTGGNELALTTSLATSSSQVSLRVAPDSTAADVTANLAAKWTLDESSGTTAASSPSGNSGTLTNGPSWMPALGRVGGSLYFDGTDDYVDVANSADLRPSTALTIAAWVKLDGTQASSARIVSKTYNNYVSPTYNSYALAMDSSGKNIVFETGHSSSLDILTSTGVNTNNWVYIVGTYDRTTKNLYINGALNASKALTTALAYDTTSTKGDLFFGQSGAATQLFKGQIDDVRIYNVALTAAQVAQLYAYETSLSQIPRTIGVDGASANNLSIARNNAAASNWLSAISTPDVAITSSGDIGIGTASPKAKVDVAGSVRIGADYDCSSSAQAGKIRYIAANTPPWQYCDGTAWKDFPGGATDSGSLYYQRHKPASIASGDSGACGIQIDGTLWCWGSNDSGRLGIGSTGDPAPLPVRVSGTDKWNQVSASTYNVCGVKIDGTGWCWGGDWTGVLGNGTTTGSTTPVQVSGTGTWVKMSVGNYTGCGIKGDGTAWCWGKNDVGQMGINSTTNKSVPTQVTDAGPWIDIYAGETSCGIKSDGTAWCWGEGGNGSLGNNSTTGTQKTPVKVSGTGTWVKLSVGTSCGSDCAHERSTVCGIKNDGTAWCWGLGSSGQIGNGTTTATNKIPIQVSGTGTWVDISVGEKEACGIKSDGTAWCWGLGSSGQLGNGTTANSTTPVQVSGTGTWIQISVMDYASSGGTAGLSGACGIKSDGTAWCWGYGTKSFLGNGTTTSAQTIPTQVGLPNPCPPNTMPYGGYCWTTSATNKSCDDACTAIGKTCNLTGIRDFSGSNGTLAHCQELLDAFHVGTGNATDNTFPFGMSCNWDGSGNRFRVTNPTTTCSAYVLNTRQICACNP